jgi:ribosomal protein L37AE/L43A
MKRPCPACKKSGIELRVNQARVTCSECKARFMLIKTAPNQYSLKKLP